MELISHISHEHPLILNEEAQKVHDDEEVVCYGCMEPISGSAANYSCSQKCELNFFLHKTCAELPKEINYPMHPQHPLTLYAHPPYSSPTCFCNVCTIKWERFTYNCNLCQFDVHITCALEECVIEYKIDGHNHSLIPKSRQALFYCDACGTEDKDFPYICTTCPLWIHKGCATSPTTIERSYHEHPLQLAHSLPETYRSFTFNCDICKKIVHPNKWVYYCAPCRYLGHIKCATDTLALRSDGAEIKVEEDLEPNFMRFPLPDGSVDLISQFFRLTSFGDNERAKELTVWYPNHPLILSDIQIKNDMDKDGILCDGCVRPISSPFYCCRPCNFFLHKNCAELPWELQHPSHKEHPLKLYTTDEVFFIFFCQHCKQHGNGFFYFCKSCNFYLDVMCAALPNKVKHEAHEHPFIQIISSNNEDCFACGYDLEAEFKFGCNTCNLHLHSYCALLPRTIRHRWDPHPIPLIYPPFKDHPDEFYCEICEEEMHPKFWLYHCSDCDQSFHAHCLYPNSNTKYGGTFQAEIHPCALTFVPKSKNESSSLCFRCGESPWVTYPVLECANCIFHICVWCAMKERISRANTIVE